MRIITGICLTVAAATIAAVVSAVVFSRLEGEFGKDVANSAARATGLLVFALGAMVAHVLVREVYGLGQLSFSGPEEPVMLYILPVPGPGVTNAA